MNPDSQPKSPFNFIQVLIAAVGTAYLNVIAFFIGSSAGADMMIDEITGEHVGFQQVLAFTLIPMIFFGLIVFLIGRGRPGICKVAQWIGVAIAVLSIVFPILNAGDIAAVITLSVIHLITAAGWFFAVHYGNKALHTK